MATVKVKFRTSSVDRKEGTLYYQVIHNRVVRQISIGYKIYPMEWDVVEGRILFQAACDKGRFCYLQSLDARLKSDVARLNDILSRLAYAGSPFTSDDVVALFLTSFGKDGFFSFCKRLIAQMRQVGKQRTAETYTTSLNSFIRFRSIHGDVPLDEMDANLMMEYESYLKSNGICPNSSSFYMRNLRAMYNRAVEQELTMQRNPFKHVYTGIDKTVKRAVSVKVIRQIRDLDLMPSMDYARDMFMFSFYTRGMSFVDMAYLKKKDLQNGVLTYRRQKTHQRLFIKWEKPMQEIVDKYDTSGSPYLLPIIRKAGKDDWRQYKNAAHLVNSKLKKIGVQLGLNVPLTTYVARHGWASIAKSKNIPISTISEAMGHDSENTTRIYLASLDTSVVDKANSIILKSI